MRIYRMTATFGKLDHETLSLQPGLNIIQAPNEWGKSTWCAFLAAMLYGLDTRAKSTKTTLADKERYAPWSGSPMAGRIDLNWNGRDISIERRTKGRIPMGEFRAYETASGLPVPELTGANCGEMLLGAEQSVFRRAGFIRLSDLPVTQDDALRRRLNALVTTGDESGDGERLARELRELKNRCRYNRSGLLPQAEETRDALETRIDELDRLDTQCKKLRMRLEEVKDWLRQLENHQAALAFAAAEADAGRVAEARDVRDQAQRQLTLLEHSCASLPSREDAQRKLSDLRRFAEQWDAAQLELQLLPPLPQIPEAPPPFQGMSGEAALTMAEADAQNYAAFTGIGSMIPLLLAGAGGLALAIGLYAADKLLPAVLAAGAAVLAVAIAAVRWHSRRKQVTALEKKYGTAAPGLWVNGAKQHQQQLQAYDKARQEHRSARGDLDCRLAALQKQRDSLCGGQNPEKVHQLWSQIMRRWEEYDAARREVLRAENHFQTLSAMAKQARRPDMEDALNYTEGETARLLSDAMVEQQRLQNRLGQYQGRMEALGDGEQLRAQLSQVEQRIGKLEDTYAALTISQEMLAQARAELQRRFAPRITRRAQELLQTMTAGRYQRLSMGENFVLSAGTGEEETLHEALWRSDGTIDQLYLALRLAVAEELMAEAPLILDDALVRFDDDRLRSALDILQKTAQNRQVILFTCQNREKNLL